MGDTNYRLFTLGFAVMCQLQLAGCVYGDIGVWGDRTGRQAAEWPIAKDVFTTAQQQILPVGLSADTPKVNPADVPLYEKYGYSAWQAGPGTNYSRDPGCPQPYDKRTELAPGYSERAPCGAAVDVLRHQRHSYHRQGIPGPADLPRLERTVRSELSQARRRLLFADHSLDDPRPRCRRPDDQRTAQEIALRFRHLSRRRLSTTPSTTSCDGSSTSWTARSSPPAPALMPEPTPSIIRNLTRPPGSTSRSPGTRSSATTISTGRASATRTQNSGRPMSASTILNINSNILDRSEFHQ